MKRSLCLAAAAFGLCDGFAALGGWSGRVAIPVVRHTRAMCASAKGGHGHGHGGGVAASDPNSFISEMRTVAMKLHTRDQAPKEGEKEAEKGAKPLRQMEPTRGGYLQFLVDSRLVYAAFEGVVQKTAGLERFIDTGLERTSALDKDIRWMVEKYPELSKPSPTQAAVEYTELLEGLSLPAFMCHFYNHYFAHTAGGLQIGKMVSSKCLDGTTLEFYKWDGDVKPILAAVRGEFDAMAEQWTREEKDTCLEETANTFKYGSSLLRSITS